MSAAVQHVWAEIEAESRSYDQHQDDSRRPPDGLHPLLHQIWRPWGRTVYGYTLVDEIGWESRLALLTEAAVALFSQTETPPRTAYLEAAIGTIIWGTIRRNIISQIHRRPAAPPAESNFVRMTSQLFQFADPQGFEDWPDESCRDEDEWERGITGFILTYVVHVGDYQAAEPMLDNPKESRLQREALRLPDNYYSAAAPDPPPTALNECRASLAHWIELAGQIP